MTRTYDTLSQAVNDLQRRGYVHDLQLGDDCVVCQARNVSLDPDEFRIDEFHRFEGMSDPEDQSIVYAISSTKHDLKGILVNAYGMDADALTQRLVAKLDTDPDAHHG
ncbi:MAG TPA: phosphoribosylpyrophosphate synthetase [Flavobacteriales bacterium]